MLFQPATPYLFSTVAILVPELYVAILPYCPTPLPALMYTVIPT
jgi:hypothetical protein